ncbi:hypothetical protein B0H16DRAFT_1564897 [Mycena metata]|uniref:Uncharacterized protein n=1 Tax=Mycena metata TaxID=1033252 RepID=A0AAD7N2K8_9AGAR|nr:hypothetical protein B0H16DRAFT_1564897 [Mycena metata]
MSSPVLPPELERIIFEMAALLRPTNIPNLMRTAWRVKNWVEPLLYRTVFIQPMLSTSYHIDEFPQLTLQGLRQQSATKPPGFFQSAAVFAQGPRPWDPKALNSPWPMAWENLTGHSDLG